MFAIRSMFIGNVVLEKQSPGRHNLGTGLFININIGTLKIPISDSRVLKNKIDMQSLKRTSPNL